MPVPLPPPRLGVPVAPVVLVMAVVEPPIRPVMHALMIVGIVKAESVEALLISVIFGIADALV